MRFCACSLLTLMLVSVFIAGTSTCSDNSQNGDETGTDCGGSCPACAPTCADNNQNGDETGTDCGGSCPACVTSTCSDNSQNGDETGTDCGGSCPVCDSAKTPTPTTTTPTPTPTATTPKPTTPKPTPTPKPKTKPNVVVTSNVPNPLEVAQSVTFTITVTGTPKPTGKVEVFARGTILNSTLALSNGVAKYTTSVLPLRPYMWRLTNLINAKYYGDGSYLAAQGKMQVQVVSTPLFETFTDASLTKGQLGNAPGVSTLTHTCNGGVTKSNTTFNNSAVYKIPFPKSVPTITTKADKPVTISISPVRTTAIYLYTSAWPVGKYTFNQIDFTLLPPPSNAAISGNILTVTTTPFSGIISIPAKTSTIKFTGPPKAKPTAQSEALIFALALPFGGPHK